MTSKVIYYSLYLSIIFLLLLLTGSLPFRRLKKKLWNKWYDSFSSLVGAVGEDIQFMNYGFMPLKKETGAVSLPENKQEQYQSNLYHYMLKDFVETAVQNKRILDVGTGRGGGSLLMANCFKARVIGMDISGQLIQYCQKQYSSVSTLNFVRGDSENLPFDSSSLDGVVNVESSHCYPDFEQFIREVHRVLKPGGYFFFADFRLDQDQKALDDLFLSSGLKIIRNNDITDHVVQAMNSDNTRKKAFLKSGKIIWPLNYIFFHFFGCANSIIHKHLKAGQLIYVDYVLEK